MLRQQAYERFKERLFAGDLKPGQFVSQRELSQVIGMPIGPVRDALKKLQAESLVSVIPQRGIRIADVNLKLVRNAFGLRTPLEVHAVRRYAESGDLARLEPIEAQTRDVLANAESDFSDEVVREFKRADFALHEVMIEALDNELISEVYRVNADRILLIRLTNRLSRQRVLTATHEHLAIFEALRRRDANAAAAAMEQHLQASFQGMMGMG
jgi:DNA-binding GntR family transcriptional regulator